MSRNRAAPWLSFVSSAALQAACRAVPGAGQRPGSLAGTAMRVSAIISTLSAIISTLSAIISTLSAIICIPSCGLGAGLQTCVRVCTGRVAGLRDRLAAEVRDALDNADLKAAVRLLCIARPRWGLPHPYRRRDCALCWPLRRRAGARSPVRVSRRTRRLVRPPRPTSRRDAP